MEIPFGYLYIVCSKEYLEATFEAPLGKHPIMELCEAPGS